jgi:hypothetical protein
MARTIAIWVFGLLASAIAGSLIAQWLEGSDRCHAGKGTQISSVNYLRTFFLVAKEAGLSVEDYAARAKLLRRK